jgi:predicted signal transduction protein with EAL and GGDEF domain
VSVGVVAINSDVESAAQVLSQADVACYAAKERGRNRVDVYRKDGAEPSPHHAQILVAATLRDALEQSRFRLFCQPIVELSGDGPPLRYELLIRLLDAGGRLVLPKAFIPAAERYGLMSAIDRWVIETAFRAYAETFAASRGVEIAINLSGESLNNDDFPKFVLEQFESHLCRRIGSASRLPKRQLSTISIARLSSSPRSREGAAALPSMTSAAECHRSRISASCRPTT